MIQLVPQVKNPSSNQALIAPVPRPATHAPVNGLITSKSDASSASHLLTVFTHEDIAERAHDIYVKSGFQQGQCDQNWYQAERDLRDHGKSACHAEHAIQDTFAPDAIGV